MITNVLLCSLSVLFCYTIFQTENIFERQGVWMEDRLGRLYKPLVGCLFCMAPWWALAYSFIFLHHSLIELVQFILAVSGLNVFISNIFSLNDSK